MKKLFAVTMSAGLILSLVACSSSQQPADKESTNDVSSNQNIQEDSFQSSNSSSEQEGANGENTDDLEMNGTQITLSIGDMEIPAVLNNTVAAREFEKILPFTVTASKGQYDYCGMGGDLEYDEKETGAGWKNGDIGYARGWFALFHSGEEQSSSYTSEMIIGHIDDDYLETVRKMSSSVKIVVELAE